MAEPLTLQFQADTSRAQSAMASLAASVVGNMASVGAAMAGGAANTNSLGQTLSGLAQNASRAAAAVASDVKNISSATVSAASREGATLEGIVRGFTTAAASSNTAQQAVRSGVAGTTTAIATLAQQIPSLTTLLGAFLAFEAAKLVFASVAASIDEARQHIESYVKIFRDAENAGVGTDFFQRATLNAEKLGLKVDQVAQALANARAASEVKIGEGKDGSNTSAIDNRLEQNVRAGNLSAADKATFDAATSQEERVRAVLNLIEKLQTESRNLAAYDLAGKFFGADFERQLRNGVDLVGELRRALDSTSETAGGQRIITPDMIERGNQLDAKLKDIANTFASALAPIERDIANAALDTYDAFLKVEEVVARVVKIASDLYVAVRDTVGAAKDLVNQIPYIGKILTAGNVVTAAKAIGQATGIIGPDEQGPPAPVNVRVRPRGSDRSNVLPSLRPSRGGGSGAESLDAVETLINQLEKARDTAKAELDNVGKTNVEREKAVALAKAEAAAREDVKKGNRTDPALDVDEKNRVLAAAEAMQKYKDATADAQQQLRQAAEATRFFGDMAANSLADAILEGKSFGDILSNLEKQIARSALNAVFTGTGPLAGLFGTAPAASAGTNAVGGLFGAFTNLFRANGGDVQAGQAYTVGEVGRELFIPNQSGRMVPIDRGSGGYGASTVDNRRSFVIDARGAQQGVAQQITTALAAYDANLRQNAHTYVQESNANFRRRG
ncbi:hypothetical protein [Methylobacterium sp. JK268]